jgi:hypothetical protein
LFLAAPANRPPVATSDTYRTTTTTAVVIAPMANDTDPDNNTLQFISWLTAPAFGALSNLGNGSFRYTPSGSVGVDVLRYNVTDGRLMATGTVTVTVGERMDGRLSMFLRMQRNASCASTSKFLSVAGHEHVYCTFW